LQRILRFPQLAEHGVVYSRMHVDRLEKTGQFPRRVHLGPNSVGWLEAEIADWLKAKIAARDRSSGSPPARQLPAAG
jgi:prophage regulatory protein